jgi:uncharacterized membrane protein YkvA (DUF1232 family)
MAGKNMRRIVSEEEAGKAIDEGAEKVTEEDIEYVVEKSDDVEKKCHGPLARFLGDVRTIIAMLKDYSKKSYREVPWWTIAAATAALLYVLNPLDIIPDFIPVFGLIDDAAVVSACVFLLERDLARYRIWKRETAGKNTEQ